MEADSHQTQVAQTRLLGAETPPQVTSTSSMLSVSTLKLSGNPLTFTIWAGCPWRAPCTRCSQARASACCCVWTVPCCWPAQRSSCPTGHHNMQQVTLTRPCFNHFYCVHHVTCHDVMIQTCVSRIMFVQG